MDKTKRLNNSNRKRNGKALKEIKQCVSARVCACASHVCIHDMIIFSLEAVFVAVVIVIRLVLQ